MYNKVLYNGNYYMNTRLFRAIFSAGNSKRDNMVRNGKLVRVKLLGQRVYTGMDKEIKDFKDAELQDINKQLEMIEHYDGEADVWKTAVIDADVDLFEFEGFTFVSYKDIHDGTKYRNYSRMAQIQVFTERFVAVNAVKRGEKKPILIELKL